MMRQVREVMVNVTVDAVTAIKSFLVNKDNRKPIRIDIHNTGCCDCSLGLSLDEVRENDLIQEIEGLTFTISPEIHELAGDVTISYVNEKVKKGFVLTSSKPLNEWDGFGVCDLKQ
jgi:Fe-S cluster assembly iron-binding protein IscA